MKYTIMECPICKKRFYNEYEEGGYIDHVKNFSERLLECRDISDKEEFIEKWAQEIYFHGNGIRDKEDIESRLNCFMLAEFIPQKIRAAVDEIVRPKLGEKEEMMKKFFSLIEDFSKSLSDDDLICFCRAVKYSKHEADLQYKVATISEGEFETRAKEAYKYKVGDKVKIADKECFGVLAGQIGEVLRIDNILCYPNITVGITTNKYRDIDGKIVERQITVPIALSEDDIEKIE